MITLSLGGQNLSYTNELFKGAAVYLTHRGHVGNQSAKVSRSKADCYSAEPPAAPSLPPPPPLRNLGKTRVWTRSLAFSFAWGQSPACPEPNLRTEAFKYSPTNVFFTCANTPGLLRMCLVKK